MPLAVQAYAATHSTGVSRCTALPDDGYKDVDKVARVCDVAGLAAPVARLRPLGVVKE